jgi:hypothetical protein
MRRTCWGREAPSQEPEKPLAQAADDQAVCCPPCLAGSEQQQTPLMSADTPRGQSIKDKVWEDRLHHLATPRGLQLRRSPQRSAGGRGSDAYELATAKDNASSRASYPLVSTADGMTVDEVEKRLIEGATRAEVMEYLGDTYGPVFVRDLIKHLHNPSCRPAT